MNNLPIGVFDSGIGGLTVLKELIKTLPNESFIYLGDTARVPYGNRDEETIRRFSLELTGFLLKKQVKALVVACNTMSAISLTEIKKKSKVPVLDVITPTVNYVTEMFKDKQIGLIATRATINSKAYENKFEELGIKIISQAVPLLVPIIEEGVLEGEVADIVVRSYFKEFRPEVLILGSTHYPLIAKTIQGIVGANTALVDTAHSTARALLDLLYEKKLLSKNEENIYKLYVTDDTKKTEEIANLFFDQKLPAKLEKISL